MKITTRSVNSILVSESLVVLSFIFLATHINYLQRGRGRCDPGRHATTKRPQQARASLINRRKKGELFGRQGRGQRLTQGRLWP